MVGEVAGATQESRCRETTVRLFFILEVTRNKQNSRQCMVWSDDVTGNRNTAISEVFELLAQDQELC